MRAVIQVEVHFYGEVNSVLTKILELKTEVKAIIQTPT
jgi:hypothetical protein